MRSLVNGGEVLLYKELYRIFLGVTKGGVTVSSQKLKACYIYVSYTFFGLGKSRVNIKCSGMKCIIVWIRAILKSKLDSGSS